jgi:AraC family transcriptional regulator
MVFHGHVIRQQVTPAFRVSETFYGANEQLPSHKHSTAYISFLLAGAYVEQTRAAQRECSMGTVIWHSAGETHSDRFSRHGAHLLNLEFQDEWLRGIQADAGLTDESCFSYGGPPYSVGLSLYHFLNTGREIPEDIATELVSVYTRCSDDGKRPDWFRRVLQFIYDSYSEPLTLSAAAKIAGVHPVHVSRSFRRLLGCTFAEYVGQVRLREAFDLLRTSKIPLAYVAAECGFADHAHLSRTFRRKTGITPSAYRKSV